MIFFIVVCINTTMEINRQVYKGIPGRFYGLPIQGCAAEQVFKSESQTGYAFITVWVLNRVASAWTGFQQCC